MPLFIHTLYKTTLRSGADTNFKIDCDYLPTIDWKALAYMVSNSVVVFRSVHSVPMGGCRLAKELEIYKATASETLLIVDDVLTTGNSMEEAKAGLVNCGVSKEHIVGVVAFDRSGGQCPDWVKPIFTMNMTIG